MPPIESLTEQSLRDYGLLGTIILLSLIFGIVYYWKRPPPTPHASPMQAVADHSKLIPLILEEVRMLGRDAQDKGKQLDDMENRLERMETLVLIIKDRQTRA